LPQSSSASFIRKLLMYSFQFCPCAVRMECEPFRSKRLCANLFFSVAVETVLLLSPHKRIRPLRQTISNSLATTVD
jgi:hypothetical protein